MEDRSERTPEREGDEYIDRLFATMSPEERSRFVTWVSLNIDRLVAMCKAAEEYDPEAADEQVMGYLRKRFPNVPESEWHR
jgi:hypothetical protein